MQKLIKSLKETQFSRTFVATDAFLLVFKLIIDENIEQSVQDTYYTEAYQLFKTNFEKTSKLNNDFVLQNNEITKEFIKIGKEVKIVCLKKEYDEHHHQFAIQKGGEFKPAKTSSKVKVLIFPISVDEDEIIERYLKHNEINNNVNTTETASKTTQIQTRSSVNPFKKNIEVKPEPASPLATKDKVAQRNVVSSNVKAEPAYLVATDKTTQRNDTSNVKKTETVVCSSVEKLMKRNGTSNVAIKAEPVTSQKNNDSISMRTRHRSCTKEKPVDELLLNRETKKDTTVVEKPKVMIKLRHDSTSSSSSSEQLNPKIEQKKRESSNDELMNLNSNLVSTQRSKRFKKNETLNRATVLEKLGKKTTESTSRGKNTLIPASPVASRITTRASSASPQVVATVAEKKADESDERLKKLVDYAEKSKNYLKSQQEIEANMKKQQTIENENASLADELETRQKVNKCDLISVPSCSENEIIEETDCEEDEDEDGNDGVVYVRSKKGKKPLQKEFNYEFVDCDPKLEEEISKVNDLRDLTPEQIKYMTLRDVNYYLNIFAGQCVHSWRHTEFKKYSNKSSRILYENAAICSYRDDQYMSAVDALQIIFGKKSSQYNEYIVKVLLPEALIKICMRIHQCSKPDAEDYLHKNNHKNPIAFKDKDKNTLDDAF